MTTNIIDISCWQQNIDFNTIKNSGIEGVIIRCGFGWDESDQKDNLFEQHYSNAKSAGLKVGAYHFSYADSVYAAEREAYTCLDYIKGKQFELPIFYDICDTGSPQCRASKQLVTDESCRFCEILESNGYYVGIYCGCSYAKNKLDYERIKRYTLWIAQYYTVCQYPYGYDMWQYTSDGNVNGYNGRLDMNYCYRDYVSEISSRGGNPVTEQKEDEKMIAELQAQVNQLQEQINNKNNEISSANAEVQRLNNLLTDTREELSQTKFDKNILSTEVAKAIKALEEERKNKPLSGDFNGDGVVNTLDALGILKHIAKM